MQKRCGNGSYGSDGRRGRVGLEGGAMVRVAMIVKIRPSRSMVGIDPLQTIRGDEG